MVSFKVENRIIKREEVWYNHKINLNNANYLYSVEIDEGEPVISHLLKIHAKSIIDKSFLLELKKAEMNYFNTIQHILDYYDWTRNTENSVTWVFNSIDDVRAENGKIIIEGFASISY